MTKSFASLLAAMLIGSLTVFNLILGKSSERLKVSELHKIEGKFLICRRLVNNSIFGVKFAGGQAREFFISTEGNLQEWDFAPFLEAYVETPYSVKWAEGRTVLNRETMTLTQDSLSPLPYESTCELVFTREEFEVRLRRLEIERYSSVKNKI